MAAMTHQANDPSNSADSADDLIRSVMADQRRDVNRNALPALEPVAEPTGRAARKVAAKAEKKNAKPQRKATGALIARIKGYRPTRRHIFWAVVAVIVIWRPWLIPGLLFVAFWVGLIAYLTLGPDRIAEWCAASWEKLSRRKPALAERLRQRADTFALKFDALLERLPDKWAEKLALPDLSQAGTSQNDLDERPDPFDKLKDTPEVYRG